MTSKLLAVTLCGAGHIVLCVALMADTMAAHSCFLVLWRSAVIQALQLHPQMFAILSRTLMTDIHCLAKKKVATWI